MPFELTDAQAWKWLTLVDIIHMPISCRIMGRVGNMEASIGYMIGNLVEVVADWSKRTYTLGGVFVVDNRNRIIVSSKNLE